MPTKRTSTRFSAKQSRKTSQKLNNSTVGTHQVRARVGKRNQMNAADMRFSSSRHSRKASRGVVSNLGLNVTSGESKRAYARRINQRDYVTGESRFAGLKTVLLVLLVIALVAGVAALVASRAYLGITGGRLALQDSTVSEYLVTTSTDTPYYTLFVADLDETNNCDTDVDMVVLARVDRSNKAVTCISFPSSLKVTLSDGDTHVLSDAVSLGGYGELLRVITTLADVDIAHIVTLDQEGIQSMVDEWGGLPWNLTEDVDDPSAGSLYIPAGQQTLSGQQLTTLLRASNFAKGVEQQSLNHCQFIADMLQCNATDSFFDTVSKADALSWDLKTDWSMEGFMGALEAFEGFDASSAYKAQIPCYESGTTDNPTYTVSSQTWTTMMAFVNVGADPAQATAKASTAVDPGSFTITVKNGSGIDGGASSIASKLTGLGFQVESTGNTDQYVYTETLVIYLDDAMEPAAESVASALGAGRVIDGTNHYVFDTDVMVILGSDWMPQS